MGKKIALKPVERVYANRGQQAEVAYRMNTTGDFRYADNVSAEVRGDVGSTQVKTAKASICKGAFTAENIAEHIRKDAADTYAYITADMLTAYEMTPSEYLEFVLTFGYEDHDSTGRRARVSTRTKGGLGGSNGGGAKVRLRGESRGMLAWLEDHAWT